MLTMSCSHLIFIHSGVDFYVQYLQCPGDTFMLILLGVNFC